MLVLIRLQPRVCAGYGGIGLYNELSSEHGGI